MALSYADVLNQMKNAKTPHQVDILMTIHGDNQNVFYGYGAMVYSQTPVLGGSGYVVETLAPEPQRGVKVLNNLAYNTGVRGSWGEYQTFVVEEPAVEYWDMKLESLTSAIPFKPGLTFPPPTITIGMGTYRTRPPYTVALGSHGVFLNGVGEGPVDATAHAMYAITFDSVSPHREIG